MCKILIIFAALLFSWTGRLGQAGPINSSYINDVAILDKNNGKVIIHLKNDDNEFENSALYNCKKFIEVKFKIGDILITGGNFTSIPADLFAKFQYLEKLILDGGKLQDLPMTLLRGLRRLSSLIIVNHRLKSIPDRLFQDTHQLSIISFANNSIEVIFPCDVFENLHNLAYLSLANNRLASLDPKCYNLFKRYLKLKKINLEGNYLPDIFNQNEREGIPLNWTGSTAAQSKDFQFSAYPKPIGRHQPNQILGYSITEYTLEPYWSVKLAGESGVKVDWVSFIIDTGNSNNTEIAIEVTGHNQTDNRCNTYFADLTGIQSVLVDCRLSFPAHGRALTVKIKYARGYGVLKLCCVEIGKYDDRMLYREIQLDPFLSWAKTFMSQKMNPSKGVSGNCNNGDSYKSGIGYNELFWAVDLQTTYRIQKVNYVSFDSIQSNISLSTSIVRPLLNNKDDVQLCDVALPNSISKMVTFNCKQSYGRYVIISSGNGKASDVYSVCRFRVWGELLNSENDIEEIRLDASLAYSNFSIGDRPSSEAISDDCNLFNEVDVHLTPTGPPLWSIDLQNYYVVEQIQFTLIPIRDDHYFNVLYVNVLMTNATIYTGDAIQLRNWPYLNQSIALTINKLGKYVIIVGAEKDDLFALCRLKIWAAHEEESLINEIKPHPNASWATLIPNQEYPPWKFASQDCVYLNANDSVLEMLNNETQDIFWATDLEKLYIIRRVEFASPIKISELNVSLYTSIERPILSESVNTLSNTKLCETYVGKTEEEPQHHNVAFNCKQQGRYIILKFYSKATFAACQFRVWGENLESDDNLQENIYMYAGSLPWFDCCPNEETCSVKISDTIYMNLEPMSFIEKVQFILWNSYQSQDNLSVNVLENKHDEGEPIIVQSYGGYPYHLITLTVKKQGRLLTIRGQTELQICRLRIWTVKSNAVIKLDPYWSWKSYEGKGNKYFVISEPYLVIDLQTDYLIWQVELFKQNPTRAFTLTNRSQITDYATHGELCKEKELRSHKSSEKNYQCQSKGRYVIIEQSMFINIEVIQPTIWGVKLTSDDQLEEIHLYSHWVSIGNKPSPYDKAISGTCKGNDYSSHVAEWSIDLQVTYFIQQIQFVLLTSKDKFNNNVAIFVNIKSDNNIIFECQDSLQNFLLASHHHKSTLTCKRSGRYVIIENRKNDPLNLCQVKLWTVKHKKRHSRISKKYFKRRVQLITECQSIPNHFKPNWIANLGSVFHIESVNMFILSDNVSILNDNNLSIFVLTSNSQPINTDGKLIEDNLCGEYYGQIKKTNIKLTCRQAGQYIAIMIQNNRSINVCDVSAIVLKFTNVRMIVHSAKLSQPLVLKSSNALSFKSQCKESDLNYAYTSQSKHPFWSVTLKKKESIVSVRVIAMNLDSDQTSEWKLVLQILNDKCSTYRGRVVSGESLTFRCESPKFGDVVKITRRGANVALGLCTVRVYVSSNANRYCSPPDVTVENGYYFPAKNQFSENEKVRFYCEKEFKARHLTANSLICLPKLVDRKNNHSPAFEMVWHGELLLECVIDTYYDYSV